MLGREFGRLRAMTNLKKHETEKSEVGSNDFS